MNFNCVISSINHFVRSLISSSIKRHKEKFLKEPDISVNVKDEGFVTTDISEICIKEDKLNDSIKDYNLPFTILKLNIKLLQLKLPVEFSLTKLRISKEKQTFITVHNFCLSLSPKNLEFFFPSALDDLLESFSETFKEHLESEKPDENFEPLKAKEIFAEYINSLLHNVRVVFLNPVLNVQYSYPDNSNFSINLQIKLDKITFFYENDQMKFIVEGISIYLCEQPVENCSTSEIRHLHEPAQILKLEGKLEILINSTHKNVVYSNLTCDKMLDVRIITNSLSTFISPCQLHLLRKIMNAFLEYYQTTNRHLGEPMGMSRSLNTEDLNHAQYDLLNHCDDVLNREKQWSQETSTDSFYSFNNESTIRNSQQNMLQNSVDNKFISLEVANFSLILLQDEAEQDLPNLAWHYFETTKCNSNHHHLNIAGFNCEYFQKDDHNGPTSNLKASTRSISVQEILFQHNTKIETHLIDFTHENVMKEDQMLGQCCELTFDQRQPQDSVNFSDAPTLEVALKPFYTEIDISMVDRIYYLFNPKPTCEHFATTLKYSPTLPDSGTKINFKIFSKFVEVALRFPIPDLRPEHIRSPAWIQNVHPEKLKLELSDLTLQTELGGYNMVYDIRMKKVSTFLVEPKCCTQVLVVEPPANSLQGFDWPRVLVSFNSQMTASPLSYHTTNMAASIDPTSLRLEIEAVGKNSLFTTRWLLLPTSKNCRTSIQIPNKKEEIKNFISQTLSNSLVTVEMTAPKVMLHLYKKDKFELLYNRLFRDLALWQPLRTNRLVESKNMYYICPTSHDSSSDEESGFHYTQFNDQNFNFALRQNKPQPNNPTKHRISLLINASYGIFRICEEANLAMEAFDSQLFVTSGYEGEEDRSMTSFQCHDAVIYYEKVAIFHRKNKIENDILTVVVSNQKNIDNITQSIDIGVGIAGALLRYKNFTETLKWVPLLKDFFCVNPYPVQGFIIGDSNCSLDISITSSAIDYFPEPVDYRAYLQLEAFLIHTNFEFYKFFLENFDIRVTDKIGEPIIGGNYVKVLESEFLEISITDQIINPEKPEELCHEIKASNNKIHVHACSDSLTAFIILIQRFIAEFSTEEKLEPTPSPLSNQLDNNESLMSDILKESERNETPNLESLSTAPPLSQEEEEEEDFEDDEFCCIDVELGSGISSQSKEAAARLLGEELKIKERLFFNPPEEQVDGMDFPPKYPPPILRYIIKEMSLGLHLYGGTDFLDAEADMPKIKNKVSPAKFSKRNEEVLMEINLNKVRLNYSVFPLEGIYDSRLVLVVKHFNIEDKLASSMLNKFLCPFVCEKYPLRSHSNQLEIRVAFYKQEKECDIYLTINPLKFNIDQTAFFFLGQYASSLGNAFYSYEPKQSDKKPLYIKTFILNPAIPCSIDYTAKNEQNETTLASLTLNYCNVSDASLMLKPIKLRGILGLDKLAMNVINEWKEDITENQYRIVLTSLGKLPYLRKAVQGIWNLFYQPYHHYMTDGRVMRGLQKGTESFKTDTVGSILEFINEFFDNIQNVALFIEGCMIPGPSLPPPGKQVPKDMQEGLKMAAEMVVDSFSNLGSKILAITKEEHKHKGLPGAIGGLTRHAPSAFVTEPVKVTSRVVSAVLEGARNHLDPDAHRSALEKWKHASTSPK